MHEHHEIRRLKKENRELKKRLRALEKESQAALPDDEGNGNCYNASNYFAYLLSRIREKNFYSTIRKYLKPSLWVTRIFRWGVLLYQYIQAGAFVILYTAVFILIIPILLVTTAITLALTLILRKHNADKLLEKVKKDVVFIIPDGKEGFDKEFIEKKCAEFSDSTVLLVSPFFLNKTGIGERDDDKMYVCYRKDGENVYILRNYFFFYFRKRLQKTFLHSVHEIRTFKDKEV